MSGQPDRTFIPDTSPKKRSHEEYRELLERHIDGELGPAERAVLFEHLEACQECRETLEAEERLLDRLSRIPRITPPVDLRAQILREAVREHQELTQPLDADERYAPIFQDPSGKPLPSQHARRRSAWSRYSPIAASAFLFVAALGALLTGDFSRAYPLAQGQALLRRAVKELATLVTPSSGSQQTDSPRRQIEIARPAEAIAENTTQLAPRTAQEEFASAAGLPQPAEQAKPVAAAIVLRSTDLSAAPSPDHKDISQALASDQSHFGEYVTNEDQFVYDGHRYHCYTLQVSPEWPERLAQSLQSYRAPADHPVLQVLSDQGHDVPSREQVAFFSAPGQVIRQAVESSAPGKTAASNNQPKLVQLYVVE